LGWGKDLHHALMGRRNNYFLKIDVILGGSVDVTHKEEVDVESWSWGETNQASPVAWGGGGAGRVWMQGVLFTASTSKASPRLFLALCLRATFQDKSLSISPKRSEYPEGNIKAGGDLTKNQKV
jgi:type VI protein secretion system component Hcp